MAFELHLKRSTSPSSAPCIGPVSNGEVRWERAVARERVLFQISIPIGDEPTLLGVRNRQSRSSSATQRRQLHSKGLCRGPIIVVGATKKTLTRLRLGHIVGELFSVSTAHDFALGSP